MSKATSIYDALVAKVIATLPSYLEMPDATEIDANPAFMMTKSFVVEFQAEANNEYHATNILNFERGLSVVLLNKIAATMNNQSLQAALKKALIEDAYTLIKATYNDLTLGGTASFIHYDGQTAIENLTIANGTEKFISTTLSFLIKYQDTF